MTLKTKVALSYILPLLLAYVGLVTALATGEQLTLTSAAASALPASAALVIAHLLQDILPKSLKEFLVFFRRFARLPGHRAFTKVCVGDPRIPDAFLRDARRKSGSEPLAQNAAWYALYRTVSEEPAVAHENLRYLAWRDATSTVTMLAILTPFFALTDIIGRTEAAWISGACLLTGLLTGTAARNAASSLVRNVVAVVANRVS